MTVWTHTDSEGLTEALALGREVAESKSWQVRSLAEAARAWRGLLVETALQQALIGGGSVAVSSAGPTVAINPIGTASDADHRKAALALQRTVQLFGGPGGATSDITTRSGASDTGFAWPVAVAAVGVSIVVAGAYGYAAQNAAELVDRYLTRRAALQTLVATHEQTLRLVRQHTEAEQEAGKSLPLNDATKTALQATIRQQEEVAKRQEAPFSSGLPSLSFGTGLGMGTIAVAGLAAAYLLFVK